MSKLLHPKKAPSSNQVVTPEALCFLLMPPLPFLVYATTTYSPSLLNLLTYQPWNLFVLPSLHFCNHWLVQGKPSLFLVQFSSAQSFSHVQLFVTPWTAVHQASLSITNSQSVTGSPLSQWCHPTISSSAIPFFCLQSFLASGSFPKSQFFASGGQSTGASASAFQWIFRTDFL